MLQNFFYLKLIYLLVCKQAWSLVISQRKISALQPATENSYVLVGHVYQTLYVDDWLNCIHACHYDPRCTSYNYNKSAAANGLCELNACEPRDLCSRHKSLIYSPVFMFQRICECSNDNPSSDWSPDINLAVPVDRPENIQKIKTTKTYIFISWDEVESNEQNGEIQGYKVNYTSLVDKIANPATKTVFFPYANLTGLVPRTKYKVTVLASNANGDGPQSDAVTFRTRTDRPSAPPANVSVFNKTSTSILVTWDEVPNGKRHGRIHHYKVEYKYEHDNYTQTKEVNSLIRYLKIENLEKNAYYNITVSAATNRGYGPANEPLSEATEQDIPGAPPQKVQAANKTSSSILVTWHQVPTNQQNGDILSYHVTYTMMNQNVTATKRARATVLELKLTGLRANTNYSITLMASTIKGDGPTSPAIYVVTEKV